MARIYESMNDVEPTSNGMRLTNSPSSAAVASRLYASGPRGSRRTSFSSEPDILGSDNDMHSDFSDISSQVSIISKRLTDMQDLQLATNEEKSRLKTENAVLQERVHSLEEQYATSEERWKERIELERQRNKELVERFERDKQLAVMTVTFECQKIKSDLDSLKSKFENSQKDVLKLQQRNHDLEKELSDTLENCESLESDRNQIKAEYEAFRQVTKVDIENSTELVQELTRQTAELRSRPQRGSVAERMYQLEEETENLREMNRELRKQNEELQSQILHDSVARGRALLSGGMSLADELNSMDSNELMNALKEQELDNQKLRQYINGILMRVIEIHPEILEIKDEELQSATSNDHATS